MKKYSLINQGLGFFIISAIGWIIDISIYLMLIYVFDFKVSVANFLSAVPAITFVFFISTKRTFNKKDSNVSLAYKYILYFIYQIVLLLCVSMLNQYIYGFLINISINQLVIISKYAKIISKIIITPITMIINFVVMKLLIEKI